MVENKRQSTKKTPPKRKSSPARKPKKPKVALAKSKIIVFCSIISGICVLSLVLTVLLNQMSENSQITQQKEIAAKTTQVAQPEKIAQKESVTKKTEMPKSEVSPQKTTPAPKSENLPAKKTENPPKKSEIAQKTSPTPPTPKITAKQESKPTQPQIASSSKNLSEKQKTQSQNPQKPPVKEPEKNPTKNQVNLAEKAISEIPKNQTPKAGNFAPQVASNKPPYQEETIQKNVPKNRFDIPPAANGATVVIIIDDAGRSAENTKRYASLPFPITIAVLPYLPQSRACADAIRSAGKEVILHQPMQSLNHNLDPGPGKITVDMSTYEIANVIKENLLSLGPGVKGLNNHEGSEVTSNVIKIGAVLEVCNEMGVYFLDSRTTAQTKAPQAALERDMHIFEKAGPYIDNEIDRAKMLERMRETLMYANSHGRAIVIGHVDKSVKILPDLLNEMYPEMKAKGYRFATPSMLR